METTIDLSRENGKKLTIKRVPGGEAGLIVWARTGSVKFALALSPEEVRKLLDELAKC